MEKDSSVSARAESFLAELALRRRLSPHTVAAYRRDLQALAKAAKETPAGKIPPDTLRRTLAREAATGKHPATAARRLSAWRMFFDHLVENGEATSNPARGLRPPKKPQRLPKALTPDETAQLLNNKTAPADNSAPAPNSKSKTDRASLRARDAAMFELLYSSALRVGELVALDLGDIDWRSGLAQVRRGKGGRGRVAPVGKTAMNAMEKWKHARATFARPGEQALFISRAGARLGARTVQSRLAQWAKAAGMRGRVSPHTLRHSCASHFLQSSGDLRATQELLGHQDIAATQIYTRLDFQNLAAVYDRSHPRAHPRSKNIRGARDDKRENNS